MVESLSQACTWISPEKPGEEPLKSISLKKITCGSVRCTRMDWPDFLQLTYPVLLTSIQAWSLENSARSNDVINEITLRLDRDLSVFL